MQGYYGLTVEALALRVEVLGFTGKLKSVRCSTQDLRFCAYGLGFRVQGLGLKMYEGLRL